MTIFRSERTCASYLLGYILGFMAFSQRPHSHEKWKIDFMAKIEYNLTRGSDVIRDGMYLELSEAGASPLRQIAEVFYSDVTHEFSFSCYEGYIPLEEIEKLIHEAKKLLPPAKQES